MILKPYWSNKQEKEQKELFIREYIRNNPIYYFNIDDREIKNFNIDLSNGVFTINYSLKGNNLKYYVSLTDSSFLIFGNKIKVLWDRHFLNYDKEILKEEVLKEMKGGKKE